MAVFRPDFDELLEPGIRKWFGDTYAQWAEEFSQVFEIANSRKAVETDHSLTGTGLVPRKPEGQAISYDEVYQAYKTQYTNLTYGLGIIISREMFEDDLYRKMQNMSKSLARSVRQTNEVVGANVLNRAFNSSYLGGDGVELCSTVHNTLLAGTYRNEPTIPADLTITAFEQALIDISTQYIDDRGLKVMAMPKKLIIHPSNVFAAKKILGSDKMPDDANNAINPSKGILPGGMTIMHYLTDPDAWFIQTDIPNGLLWFWRRKTEFGRDNDFDSEVAKYKTTQRHIQGWTDPRAIYGSPGA